MFIPLWILFLILIVTAILSLWLIKLIPILKSKIMILIAASIIILFISCNKSEQRHAIPMFRGDTLVAVVVDGEIIGIKRMIVTNINHELTNH